MHVVVYFLTGVFFGFGIIDNDPIVKILCTVTLMVTTMVFVYDTWAYLFKEKENV
jgi:hypothetical protein